MLSEKQYQLYKKVLGLGAEMVEETELVMFVMPVQFMLLSELQKTEV